MTEFKIKSENLINLFIVFDELYQYSEYEDVSLSAQSFLKESKIDITLDELLKLHKNKLEKDILDMENF
jgi:hypothetical protein